MFRNKSFEGGHRHPTGETIVNSWHYATFESESEGGDGGPIVPELQLPNRWGFVWSDSTMPNPYSSEAHNQFVRPEVRVLNENELPEHERPLYIKHGTHTLKIFKGYGAWYAALYQRFTFEPGLYQAHLNIYNDAYHNNKKQPALDPHSCQVRIKVHGLPSEWRPLFPQHMDSEAFLFNADGPARIRVEIMMPFAVHNSGIFADLWDIVQVHKIAEKCEHFGLPREQYDRTYVLLPPSYAANWMRAAVNGGWNKYKYSFGGSADDAGIGNLLVKRVIAVNPQEWDADLKAFYAEHYPHVEYLSITAATPEELTQRLKNNDFDNGTPPPNGGYEGPHYVKNTRGHWGLHAQILRDGVWQFLQNTTPGVMKYFGLTDVEISINANPATPVVYRHFTENQNIPDNEAAIRQSAIDYIAQFKDDAHKKAESLAANHNFRPLFWVESFNEMYPSLNLPMVRKAALFDQFFAEEMYKEFGKYVGAALFCAAVGNPHENEYNELIRVAQAAIQYDGLLSYHNYWWANTEQNGLLSWWKFHAGRWQDIDNYLKKFKLYPRWYSGESGVVHSYDGYALNPGAGWLWPEVYGGDYENKLNHIIADILAVDILDADWNAENGNRYLGNVFFTTGAHWTGWEWFQWQKPEFERLETELFKLYPSIPQYTLSTSNNRVFRAKNRIYYKTARKGRKIRYIR